MSRAILARVVALDLYAGARMIMAYCAHGSEVMTDELIARAIADGKRVAVPRVVDSAACVMHPAEIRSLAELAPGAYGIREPRGATQCPSAEEIDMVLVPGIVLTLFAYPLWRTCHMLKKPARRRGLVAF